MNLLKETINHMNANKELFWNGSTIQVGKVESVAYNYALSALNEKPSMISNLASRLVVDEIIEERGEEINQENRAHYIAESVALHDALSWKVFANS